MNICHTKTTQRLKKKSATIQAAKLVKLEGEGQREGEGEATAVREAEDGNIFMMILIITY